MKEKLKILVFNWQDITNPLAGGAEVHLHEVFERIAACGHEVTLFCHHFRRAPREEVRNGMRIIRYGARSVFNFIVPIAYFLRFKRERYDVIIDDINKIPFYTPLFVSEPVQAVTHHLFGKSIFLETIYPFALYVHLCEKLIKPVYRQVHFIIGSPSTYKEYRDWGFDENHVAIVNYCVNKTVYYPSPQLQSYIPHQIAYFGRLKKYKSVDHLLHALSLLRHEHPGLHLTIIGDGDDKDRLTKRTVELGLTDAVTFTGFIDENMKAPLLQQMNFVVNTSSKEGWGLTVVEANACGAPVVAANVPGLRDAVVDGETGLLYEYGNIPELVEKINILLRDPARRNALQKNALEWAASFDWDKAAEKTLSYIHQTIAKQ